MRVIAERYVEIANTRRAGGQGEVFQAADVQQAGRTVAVKIIPAASDDLSRIYFQRETAALHTLSHPNIAALRDSGTDEAEGVYYVVLDWVPETIKTWLAGFADPPGWDDVADSVALPLASALAHSHALSVLHRDIKPGNVLWDGKKPLLADFALSKIKSKIAGASDATVLGATAGPWAPPDQASRGSARFDVYGLAATLLQCVTKQEFQDYHHIAHALAEADPPPPVVELLKRALDPDPANRPADGQVFYLELQAIQTARSANWHRRREIAFELSTTARQALEAEGGGSSAEAVIEQRIGSATYVGATAQNLAGRSLAADGRGVPVDRGCRRSPECRDRDLVLKAVEHHTDQRWIVLYVQRWLTAGLQHRDGTVAARDRGSPQGSAISSLLANLFMHYAFDSWMVREFPDVAFERYCDDAVVHCVSEQQAHHVRAAIATRLGECGGLRLHPDETRIVYCKDAARRGDFMHTSFTFLGYGFRSRMVRTKRGKFFFGFNPAISDAAAKGIRGRIRSWRLHHRSGSTLAELAREVNLVVRGWMNYYGRFHRSALQFSLNRINDYLVRWLVQKYKRFRGRWTRAREALRRAAQAFPRLFAHWAMVTP